MKNVSVESTRNFALVGHAADGKTSLGDALLHRAGATPVHGKVDDGSSVLNHLPEEKERRSTISSSVFGFDWNGHHLTLVDTPGDPNFIADGQIALQGLDGAVLVVSGVDGPKVGTEKMLRTLERLGVKGASRGADHRAAPSATQRGDDTGEEAPSVRVGRRRFELRTR